MNKFEFENHWYFILPIFLFCVEIFGNFALFSIVIYEKYGMDPKKRNVTNQLTSTLCIIGIFENVFILPFVAYRILVGPVNTILAIWGRYKPCGKFFGFLWDKFPISTNFWPPIFPLLILF